MLLSSIEVRSIHCVAVAVVNTKQTPGATLELRIANPNYLVQTALVSRVPTESWVLSRSIRDKLVEAGRCSRGSRCRARGMPNANLGVLRHEAPDTFRIVAIYARLLAKQAYPQRQESSPCALQKYRGCKWY